MVLDDSHMEENKMKRVSVLLAIFTIVVGVNCLAEPGESQSAVRDESNEQLAEDTDRSGYGVAIVNAATYRPMARPLPATPLNTVECHVCTDCPTVLGNTTSKTCPYTLDPTKQSKCVVYAEQYRLMKKPLYIRGCASERGTCSDIRKAHSIHNDIVKLLQCYECEGDKCNTNSASLSLIDLTMACFAMVVTPLVAKYTLS